jgi:hypothetical protein
MYISGNIQMNNWLTEKQLEAVDMIVKRGRGVIWWKVGEGKTRIALEAYVRMTGCQTKLLVVCSPQAYRQWRDEARLHPSHACAICMDFMSYGILSTPAGQKWINYYLQDRSIGMIALDELWLYKRVHTMRSKAISRLTLNRPTVGLSGSLITNRNIEDIYGQCNAVGLGRQIATSLTHFRTQFCVSYEDFGLKFAAKKGALEAIQKRIAPFCNLYFPSDIRESRIYRISVDPTQEQVELFDTCQNDYYAKFAEDSEMEIRNAGALIIKLQQISDGVVLDGAGQAVSVESSKYLRLLGILEELFDAGERAVVWFAFKASLGKVYTALGKKATCLSSDHAFDSEGWRAGKYRVTLATAGSGSSLNDFANTRYAIIYSAPFSYRAIQQAMGRTNRKSSEHPVAYYQFLQTVGGIDKLVYDTLRLTGDIESGVIKSSIEIVKEYMQNKL